MFQINEFYNTLRPTSLFNGKFTQSQVENMDLLLQMSQKYALTNYELAYIFATVYHETVATMKPLEEYGKGVGKFYGQPINGHVYYGRGYVQLTWFSNYEKLGCAIGIDLVGHPEYALQPHTAAQILFMGMTQGLFTTFSLGDFFTPLSYDFYNARKIVNGLNQASRIEAYADIFLEALNTAHYINVKKHIEHICVLLTEIEQSL